MSNVVPIGLPRRPNLAQRQTLLIRNFALHRRSSDDVYWLKENAELLSILAATEAKVPVEALSVYREFYDGLEDRMRFFPQYYRFLLSICLDLEKLGFHGSKSTSLCQRAQRSKLAEAELSDLQRAEARYLMERGGEAMSDPGLTDRLDRFCDGSLTFAVPNKKAAYELTHIVFYRTDYGRQQIDVGEGMVTSLEYAGLLAYLDQDIDLLAEICVALRFVDVTPSDIWEDWLAHETIGFSFEAAQAGPQSDDYHEYIVTNWWAKVAGLSGAESVPLENGMRIVRRCERKGALRAVSEVMYQLGPARSGDWHRMRHVLERSLGPEQHIILEGAAQSSTRFDSFFEGFSRAH